MKQEKISISKGNEKMGNIPSVSLPPVVTCAKNCTCAKKCYAVKLTKIYPSVKKAYDRNLEILKKSPRDYFKQIDDICAVSRFFRWHVSGDIPNDTYFLYMLDIAKNNPYCEMLVFTKKYNMINAYIDGGIEIPKNLHIIFSEWDGMELKNPHNLPVAHVVFKGETPQNGWHVCSGNCLDCARMNVKCWNLKHGEHVAFYEH